MARKPTRRARKAQAAQAVAPERFGSGACALLALAYFALLLALYARALTGPFVSDDFHYVAVNPYVHGLSFTNIVAILTPWGPSTIAIVNYSPVQLCSTAVCLRRRAWHTRDHASTRWRRRCCAIADALRVPSRLRRGASFLLHPSNVEPLAWISP